MHLAFVPEHIKHEAEGLIMGDNGILLPAGHGFVIGKDLIRQLVHKLVETQVHLRKGEVHISYSGINSI